jgi:hypothetical protein
MQRSRHEARNPGNIRPDLDGPGSAGPDLVRIIDVRGCVDVRIDDIAWRERWQRRSGPGADDTQSVQHRPVPAVAAAAVNARSSVDPADSDSREHEHRYAVGKRHGRHRPVHDTRRHSHGDARLVDLRDARHPQRHCDHGRRPVWCRPVWCRRIDRTDQTDPAQLANLVRVDPDSVDAYRQERPQRDSDRLHEALGAGHAYEQGRVATHLPPCAGQDRSGHQTGAREVERDPGWEVASPATACQRGWTNAVTELAKYRTQPDTGRIRTNKLSRARLRMHTQVPVLEQLSALVVPALINGRKTDR